MRVLILTCNTGGGHNAVAAALAESFRRLGVRLTSEPKYQTSKLYHG